MRTLGITIEIRDCGRASKITRGFPVVFFYEIGFPPFIGTFAG
jgi:hypothetical protein